MPTIISTGRMLNSLEASSVARELQSEDDDQNGIDRLQGLDECESPLDVLEDFDVEDELCVNKVVNQFNFKCIPMCCQANEIKLGEKKILKSPIVQTHFESDRQSKSLRRTNTVIKNK